MNLGLLKTVYETDLGRLPKQKVIVQKVGIQCLVKSWHPMSCPFQKKINHSTDHVTVIYEWPYIHFLEPNIHLKLCPGV